jgi:DNA-binding IclR family transcriptional regulator
MAETTGTVARALSVLTVLAEAKDSVGVKEVAAAVQLPMSTSHRLLELLLEAGFVEKDENRRRYVIGMEFLRVANLVAQNSSYATMVQPALDRITKETGETSLYSSYLPAKHAVTYSAKSDSPNSLRFRIVLFQETPVEWGASGQAILAYLPPDVQAEIQAASNPAPTTRKRLSRAAFFERIEAVKRNGYAFSESEKLADSIGIAVPVMLDADRVGGSITLTIPKVRFVRAKLGGYVALLKKEAEALLRRSDAAPRNSLKG